MGGSDEADPWVCPIPDAHDRFFEAAFFLREIERNYHQPREFRYCLNAFLSALRATADLLGRELDEAGHGEWWKSRRSELLDDPVLAMFARGRNLVLHQRSIFNGSNVAVGLFRNRTAKLTPVADHPGDEPSESLLRRMVPSCVGTLLHEDHPYLGEQVSVHRRYLIPELSADEDALTASHRALARLSKLLSDAHGLFGGEHVPMDEHEVISSVHLTEITVLLETDLDPSLAEKWGW